MFITLIWHLPFGSSYSCLKFDKKRLRRTKCGLTKMQTISFQAEGHHITQPLYRYTIELLARGTYTLKEVGWLTGLIRVVFVRDRAGESIELSRRDKNSRFVT